MFFNFLGEGSEHSVFSNRNKVFKINFDARNKSLEELLEHANNIRDRNLVSE